MKVQPAALPARGAEPAIAQKLHPYLRERLQTVASGQRVPVYVTFAERQDLSALYARVATMPLEQRRQLAIAELQAHAARCQGPLSSLLQDGPLAAHAELVASNWLGNFLELRADEAALHALTRRADVESLWWNGEVPRPQVEDGAAIPHEAPSPAAPALAGCTPGATFPIPGDGPLSTRAFAVWAHGILGQGVLIANVDGGITSHADLDQRRWTNAQEIPGNGIDDDQNGFVDDVHGYAFDQGNSNLDDGGGHGTATAGLLVGDGACSGIAHGQAPGASLMSCRTLNEASQWNAVQYAVQMGAHIQTSSFSYKASFVPPPNYRMHRCVAMASLAAGLARTNSSGNDRAFAADPTSPARVPLNISAPACVPPPYLDPAQSAGGLGGVLGVGAWRSLSAQLDPDSPMGPFAWALADIQGNLPGYPAAQWDGAAHEDYPFLQGQAQGLLKPDLLGPTQTTTTGPGPCRTQVFGGTSAATPAVAGAMALWKCANPSLGPEDLALIAHQTAVDQGPTAGKENGYGSGVVDAYGGFLRSLCLLRANGASRWALEHPTDAAPLALSLDGVPSSLCCFLLGYARQPALVLGVELGIGVQIGLLAGGVTDAAGDFTSLCQTPSSLQGTDFSVQAVLFDQTYTGTPLASNVIDLRLR